MTGGLELEVLCIEFLSLDVGLLLERRLSPSKSQSNSSSSNISQDFRQNFKVSCDFFEKNLENKKILNSKICENSNVTQFALKL